MLGKLVEQNPQEAISPELRDLCDAEHVPNVADLPANWVRAKVGKLLNFQYGKGLSEDVRQEAGPVRVFGSNGIVGYCSEFLTEKPAIIIGRKGSAGALNLCDGPSWTTDVAYFLVTPAFFDIRYLFVALQTLDLDRLGKGVKPGLSRSDAYGLDLSVPPMAEQQRIITRLEELMALCDRLEPAMREQEKRRNGLAAASLHHMCNDSNPEALRGHSRFYLAHLPELTLRPEQIAALRQAVLSLAVQGKLVQQHPEDGSAESLVAMVSQLHKKNGNRPKKSNVDDSDPKFVQHLPKTLPHGWVACPLEDLFRFIDYRGRTPTRTAKGVRLITAKNVRMGYVSNEPVEFIDDRAYKQWMTRGFPQNGDLLFVTEGATMGFVGTIELQFEFALAQRTIDLQPYLHSYSRFVLFTLMSPIFQEAVLTNSTGTAVKGIKAAKLKRIRVPLPPLAEQQRIVARVNEFMALCDRLETQLSTIENESSRLLEAVFFHALNDNPHVNDEGRALQA